MKTIEKLLTELDKIEFMRDCTRGAQMAASYAKQTLSAAFWQTHNFNALAEETKAVSELYDKLDAKAYELSKKAIELRRQADKIREEIVAREAEDKARDELIKAQAAALNAKENQDGQRLS